MLPFEDGVVAAISDDEAGDEAGLGTKRFGGEFGGVDGLFGADPTSDVFVGAVDQELGHAELLDHSLQTIISADHPPS